MKTIRSSSGRAHGHFVRRLDVSVAAVLFDLDETLVPEAAAVDAAFRHTVADIAFTYGRSRSDFVRAVRATSRELWHGFREYEYRQRVGISSWDGLWGDFSGATSAQGHALGEWVPEYRSRSWRGALATVGIDDRAAAATLARRFVSERRAHLDAFPDALATGHVLALLAAMGAISLNKTAINRLANSLPGVMSLPPGLDPEQVIARRPAPYRSQAE